MPQDYYQLLGVPKNADTATIKQAYRKQISRHHPDRLDAQGEEMARLLNLAYETLKDPVRRAQYDRSLDQWASLSVLAAQTMQQTFRQVGKQAKRAWQFLQHNLQQSDLSERLHAVWAQPKSVRYPVCHIDLVTSYFGACVPIELSGRTVMADIPKGVTDGEILRIRVGEQTWLVKARISQASVRTEGVDVHYSVVLTAEQAASIAPIVLPKPFSLQLFAPKQQNYPSQICLTGKGIPSEKGAGDLYVHLSIR